MPCLFGTAPAPQARLVFAHYTAYPWQEELKWQQGALGWPALLLILLYSSRGLVASWGALGWQLPLVWHSIVQALHVVLAGWRLAPAVCQAGGPLHRTPDKLQSLALMLDWCALGHRGPACGGKAALRSLHGWASGRACKAT